MKHLRLNFECALKGAAKMTAIAMTLFAGFTASCGSKAKNVSGNAGDTQFAVMKNGWPSKLAPDLPVFPGNNQTGWSQYQDGTVNIVVAEAMQAGFDAYLKTLRQAGWNVKDAGPDAGISSNRGAYSVRMQLMGGVNLAIELKIAATGGWPLVAEFPIPAKMSQPDGYRIIDLKAYNEKMEYTEGTVTNYMLHFACIDMNEDAAEAYLGSIRDKGCFAPFVWQGKTYNCQLEQNYSNGANMEFDFSISPEN